jgi:hypothetical protein
MKTLTCEVAARHGLLIRDGDPVMALVTMSEIVFGAGLGKGRGPLAWRHLRSRKRAEKSSTRRAIVGPRRDRGALELPSGCNFNAKGEVRDSSGAQYTCISMC